MKTRHFTRQILDKGASVLDYLGRWIYQSEQERRVIPWIAVHGDETLRLEYDLDARSTVFDLGGYKGQWASDIFAMYCCTVHIFEPVQDFAVKIQSRFEQNRKLHVHVFGLGGQNRAGRIAVNQDGSSMFKESLVVREIKLVCVSDFIRENHIEWIDLMKINIEGSEYEVLEDLISTGLVHRIRNIQVQFHDFVPRAKERMLHIQCELQRTHAVTYQYPFVWENWRLMNGSIGNEIRAQIGERPNSIHGSR